MLARSGINGAEIIAASGTYKLELPADTWVDLDAAADAIHRAETAQARGQLDEACGWALAARAIGSRPLLPGIDGAWLERERARLGETLLRALACLGEVWIASGDPELAARDAETAIRLDPYREVSHRLLIRARLAAGDRGAARRAFEACRQVFRDDLGVEPSAETAALVPSLDPW